MSSVEELLYDAAWGGHASEVLSLLRVHPEVNINWGMRRNGLHFTLRHPATMMKLSKCFWHTQTSMST